MKKLTVLLLLLLLTATMLLPLGVAAEVTTAEDYLTFQLVDGTYTVTDCVASYKGDLIIPAEKDGKPVTAIGDTAFFGCHSLSMVLIPDSVTTIGNQAFQGCTNLRKVTIPASVTSIGFDAFNGTNCYHTADNWENGVLYIGDCAVATKETLAEKVYLRQNTRLIASDTFFRRGMKAVFIPTTVTHINTRAFGECDKLTEVLYGDKKAAWNKVAIAEDNQAIRDAKVRYNASGKKVNPWLWVSIVSGAAAVAGGVAMVMNARKAKRSAAEEPATEDTHSNT